MSPGGPTIGLRRSGHFPARLHPPESFPVLTACRGVLPGRRGVGTALSGDPGFSQGALTAGAGVRPVTGGGCPASRGVHPFSRPRHLAPRQIRHLPQ